MPAAIYLGDIAPQVNYPNVQFEVVQLADPEKLDRVVLVARCTSTDTNDPTKLFTVVRGREVPAYYETARDAACAIRDLMHYVACHEVDEMLTYEGRPVFNPHSTWELAERP